MKYDTRLEFFQDLKNLKASQIEDAIDSFTNEDPGKYNRLVLSFIDYVKEGIIEAYRGYSYNKTGNEIHFFTDDKDGINDVLEFSERFGLVKNNSIEWRKIKITNTNPIDKRLLYFEVLTAKFQSACSVLFLNKTLAANLNKTIETKNLENPKLTVDQKALKMVYENTTIVTRQEHGNDLYNKVTKWSKTKNRIANPDSTNLVLENKIKLFESVIELLAPDCKQKPIDEVKILKSYLPNK